MIDIKKIIVHGGIFHADDVFSVALCWMLFGRIPLERRFPTQTELGSSNVLVIDTGRMLDRDLMNFDHHQLMEDEDDHYAREESGVPYSGFGLVYRYLLKPEKFEDLHGLTDPDDLQEVKDRVERSLVWGIDAADNGKAVFSEGICPVSISHCINALNPTIAWGGERDEAFVRAVNIAADIIQGKFRHAGYAISSKQAVLASDAALDGQVLVLDHYYPWQESMLLRPEQEKLLFCVHPSSQKGYMVIQVPVEPGSKEGRCSLPASWAGLDEETLRKVSGVPDATFCHNNLFCGAALSEAGALSMAEKAIEQAATPA
jgi:uncharacterized UPF0160 family protein